MEFHISRAVRKRYNVNELLFNYAGNVVFANLAASREFADRVREVRSAESSGADQAAQSEPVSAGALFAMGLIDELNHALIARFRLTRDPQVLSAALDWFASQTGATAVETLLARFTDQFPNAAIFRGEQTVEQWLAQTVEDLPNREAAVEELLLLWLANTNPAYEPFKEFFDDEALKQQTVYGQATASLDSYFATRPSVSAEQGTLLDVLRAPIRFSPDSLSGQLDYIREHWSEHIGAELRQIFLAIDVIKEEDVALWMRFHPSSAAQPNAQGGANGWGGGGFVGDEFVGFDVSAGGEHTTGPSGPPEQAPVNEYEAFSPDQAWMPSVVLMAKSTYVWLEQLSKKYGRHIHRLDQIPDEELTLMAGRGLNGLWLIGLWERSIASQTIKRLRGQSDAVASAYSVRDYRIAEDLGGEAAYEHLRDRAAAAGIRLASDMVPNHMGIDSTWVIEHPEWFLSRPDTPFPVYRFEGPDVSTDSRIEIKIEDQYYDQTDAAVVFRRRERATGHSEFIYHGNDGTTFAWNDTAQLNYAKAEVREQVMQTILQVARLFPIIRFDAAMTLAKKHVQRLWFPLPGAGGAIPSRSEYAMPQAEFDALMPNEFWREVVDRVAVEVPGTLLLAEAFWLLEGYFVRTLGMHRVYNSAFMHMLRDEENAKYRSYLKKTLDFDPDILKRYVNFMSNPDERTAIDQFGTGDKYFGVCTLLATLPGLPMFGHGQIEGFTEKYGMEYKRARLDESPQEGLVARHQREIAPLLKRRDVFAESTNFALYDFWSDQGVDENVFAYSNRSEQVRTLVLFNNSYGSTHGTIHESVEYMDKSSGTLRRRQLTEALQLPASDESVLAYKDTVTGLEYLRRPGHITQHGLTFPLRGYQYAVLQDWRELHSTAERPWHILCDALNGEGVYSLDETIAKLRLHPLREALRRLLDQTTFQTLAEVAPPKLQREPTELADPEDIPVPADKKMEQVHEIAAAEQTQTAPIAPKQVADGAAATPTLDPALAGLVLKAQAVLRELSLLGELPEEEGIAEEFSAYANLSSTLTRLHASRTPRREASEPAPSTGEKLKLVPATGAKVEQPTLAALPAAALLAWVVLRHVASDKTKLGQIFDHLQLRSTLAEIFSSVGIAGEDAWRGAALVRLFLSSEKPEAVAFWEGADVRWLAGVTEAYGTTYFVRERFEEVLGWLELPEIVDCLQKDASTEDLAEVERKHVERLKAAENSGYTVDGFLKLSSTTPSSQPITTAPKVQVEVVDPAQATTEVQKTTKVQATTK